MKLFKITQNDNNNLFVAAEDFKRATECYDHIKSIEKIEDKIVILKNRDGSTSYEDIEWRTADSRFPPKDEHENVIEYIQRLGRMIVNCECSIRGYQYVLDRNKFNSEQKTIKT